MVVSEPVAVREGMSVPVCVGLGVKVGLIVPVLVSVLVAEDVEVRVSVPVGGKVGGNVRLDVGGSVVRISAGVSVVKGEMVPTKPLKEGRLPGSVAQAVRNDKITRQIRMLLQRMSHSKGSSLNHTAKTPAFLLVIPWQSGLLERSHLTV